MKAVLMVVAASCQGYALHSQEFNTHTFVLPKNSAAGRIKLADPDYQQLTRDVADVASHHTDEILDASIEALNSFAKNGVQGVAGENSFQQLSAELKHSLSAKTFESDGAYVGVEVRLEAKKAFGPGVDFLVFGAFKKGAASKLCFGVAGGSEYNMKNAYGKPDDGEEFELMLIAGGIHYDDLPTKIVGQSLPFLEFGGEVDMRVAPSPTMPLKVDGLAAKKLDDTRETFLAGVEINIPMHRVMQKLEEMEEAEKKRNKLQGSSNLQVDESNVPLKFSSPIDFAKSKVTDAKHWFEENLMKIEGLDAELNAGGIFCKEVKEV